MEQSIFVRFRWTADDLSQAYRYHFRHTCRLGFRFGLHFLFGALLLGGVLMLTTSGPAGKAPLLISLEFMGVGIYWFVFRSLDRRWAVRRQFKKRPDRDVELEWRIDANKIQMHSALGQSEVQWQAFTKMLRTPAGVILYPNDQIYHLLPRRGFESDAEFERFVVLAKSKIQTHYDVE
jgi:YcxB-like protein